MDGARDAVVLLDVHLRDSVHVIDGSLLKISLGGGLDHVTNEETLDSLILRDATRAVHATNRLDGSTSLAVLSSVSSFLGHIYILFPV